MVRWAIFCGVIVYLFLASRPVMATVRPYLPQAANASQSRAPLAALPLGVDEQLRALSAGADLIVAGRVWAVHSHWNATRTLIESEAALVVEQTWVGHAGRTIQIRTTGGYLPDARLGLLSLHEATFTVGEEVLLFARQVESHWQVVAGAAGKFRRQGEQLMNADLALTLTRSDFVAGLERTLLARQSGGDMALPQRVARLRPVAAQPLLMSNAPLQKWATPHARADFYLNLNTAQIDQGANDRAAFRTAIINAATSWSTVPAADFALHYAGESKATATGYNGINEVLFMPKGATERAAAAQVWYTGDGTIVEADIWINDDVRWNATGQPAADEVDLQSALLHEFGHWLILSHTAQVESIMFPKLAAGATKRTLQSEDMAGISAIYPR